MQYWRSRWKKVRGSYFLGRQAERWAGIMKHMRFRAGATILAKRTDENQCQPAWNTEAACHQVFYPECYLLLPLLALSFSKLFWDALGRFLYQDLVRSSQAAGGSFSLHLCVIFLFLVLYPARTPASSLRALSFTHNSLTHNSFTHSSFTHNSFSHTTLSHTALSHTTLSHSHTHTADLLWIWNVSDDPLVHAWRDPGPPSLRNRWNQCYCWGKDPMCQLPILEF